MGVYLVYHREITKNEKDVVDCSYILKPTNGVDDFFSSMYEIRDAIEADNNKDFYEDGDTHEYCIIDLCTNTMKTVRATYCLTPSIIIE